LFGISTQGQTGEKPWDKFRENLRKAIAEGLSPEAALKALTVDAARILGVEKQLGTIAPGKAAHLIVTDGDLQEEKTFVRYAFPDGVRFEYEKTQVAPRPGYPRRPTDDAAKPDDSKKPDDAKKPDDPKKPDDAKKPDDKKAETTKVEQPTEIE